MLYKQKVKGWIETRKKGTPGFTLSKVAESLAIEPSYLSRFLSDPDVHFSDDLLCRLLTELEISSDGIDYIFLLKDYDRTVHEKRKLYLKAKIKAHQLNRWKIDLAGLRTEINGILQLMQKIDD
jgi:transcriptional regulator with XRE-family HTH domain